MIEASMRPTMVSRATADGAYAQSLDGYTDIQVNIRR